MNKLMIVLLSAALAACGSKKDKEAPPPPPPTPTAGSAMTGSAGSGSAAAMTGSAGSAEGSAVDVPTEMDFEAQAKSDITDKNVDQEVKKIEEDLGGK